MMMFNVEEVKLAFLGTRVILLGKSTPQYRKNCIESGQSVEGKENLSFSPQGVSSRRT